MKTFDRYIFKNLLIASLFVTVVLTVVIFLTQSLKYLELVIESGASSSTFWGLTVLALPRFMEIILPLALMISVLFTYNRMTADSELIVIKAIGHSPINMARPAIILSLLTTLILLCITMWGAPKAISALHSKRHEIKEQFSSLIFKEGIFNQIDNGLTVYAREQAEDGTLYGLMIHDGRTDQQAPSTIIAKTGILSVTNNGFEVLVFDGQRQEYSKKDKSLSRLNFDRYTIEVNDEQAITDRWKEPDERTIFELLSPSAEDELDKKYEKNLKIEIHRRIISPLLAITLAVISCTVLIVGPINRRGQIKRVALAVLLAVLIQSLYIAAFNIAKDNLVGLLAMYILVLAPIFSCLFLMSPFGDSLRRNLLFIKQRKRPA